MTKPKNYLPDPYTIYVKDNGEGCVFYKCEMCRDRHYHGAGAVSEDGFAYRVSHCIYLPIHTYRLTQDKSLDTTKPYMSRLRQYCRETKQKIGEYEGNDLIKRLTFIEYKDFEMILGIYTEEMCKEICKIIYEKYDGLFLPLEYRKLRSTEYYVIHVSKIHFNKTKK